MGQIKYTTSLALIMLFTLAVVGYAIGYASDNSAAINIDEDGQLSGLNSSMYRYGSTMQIDTSNSSTAFFESTISGAEQTTVTGGEFKKGFSNLKDSIDYIFGTSRKVLFGGNPVFGIVFTVFSSLIVLLGFLYIWKVWKGGNPD